MERKYTVVIIFEPACDLHWMKDVVQFPNAIASSLEKNSRAILITRPNDYQEELKKHIDVVLLGNKDARNDEAFRLSDQSNIFYDPFWYLQACKLAAEKAQVLVLYPWFGDFKSGSRLFKITHKNNAAKVILKTDGYLLELFKALPGWRLRWKERRMFKYIDHIICENEEIYKTVLKSRYYLADKIKLIPNCPVSLYDNLATKAYNLRSNNFLFVGRVDDKEKGIDILMNAWIAFNKQNKEDWNLTIVGPSSDEIRNKWNEILISQNCPGVSWEGNRLPAELMQYYQNAKIVICSSRKESGPIVLLEASKCGCAFIGTMVGEIPHFLDDGVGLVTNEMGIEKWMLKFATDEVYANAQANRLKQKMLSRTWMQQVKTLNITSY